MTKKYDVDIEWIKERLFTLSWKEIIELYNEEHNCNYSVDVLRRRLYENGHNKLTTDLLKSDECRKWIYDNKDKFSNQKQLIDAVNEKFKMNFNYTTFNKIYPKLKCATMRYNITKEQDKWISENILNYTIKENKIFYNDFQNIFHTNLTIKQLDSFRNSKHYKLREFSEDERKYNKNISVEKKKAKEKQKNKAKRIEYLNSLTDDDIIAHGGIFTIGMVKWLEKNCSKYRISDLINEFHKEYGNNITSKQLKSKINNASNNLHCPSYFKFTKEHLEWIKNNYDNPLTSEKIKEMFNKEFEVNVTASMIKNKARSLGCLKSKENLAKMYSKTCKKTMEIGSERIINGYIYKKIANNPRTTTKNFKETWDLKQRYVWKQHYGDIPKDYVIGFKDGNRLNCDIDNLFMLKKSDMSSLVSNEIYGKGVCTEAYLEILKTEKILEELENDK